MKNNTSNIPTDFLAQAEKIIRLEAQAILGLIPQLTADFNKVIPLILRCKGKLVVTGMGKSGLIGRKMVATFASTGTPSFFLHPSEAFHGDLGMVAKEDIVLAISKSGETTELLQLIPFFKKKHIPIIALTGKPQATLAKHAQYTLNISVEKEACPLDLAPTSSATAALVMGDALALVLLKARHFQPADFALLHPGGSLGKKLLTSVKDIMFKEQLPIIDKEAEILEVINNMTRGKLGLIVIEEKNKIIGIITDGDLRRTLEQKKQDAFGLKAKDFMTYHPVIIPPDWNMSAAERLMVEKKITSLLVAEDRKLVGVVQIYNVA